MGSVFIAEEAKKHLNNEFIFPNLKMNIHFSSRINFLRFFSDSD